MVFIKCTIGFPVKATLYIFFINCDDPLNEVLKGVVIFQQKENPSNMHLIHNLYLSTTESHVKSY